MSTKEGAFVELKEMSEAPSETPTTGTAEASREAAAPPPSSEDTQVPPALGLRPRRRSGFWKEEEYDESEDPRIDAPDDTATLRWRLAWFMVVALIASIVAFVIAVLVGPSIGGIDSKEEDQTTSRSLDFTVPLSAPMVGLGSGFLALFLAGWFARSVLKCTRGTQEMASVSIAIKQGTAAYLRSAVYYVTIAGLPTALFLFIIVGAMDAWNKSIVSTCYFIVGIVLSTATSLVGVHIAIHANVRTTEAARSKGLSSAMKVSVNTGAVTSLTMVGLVMIGVSILYIIAADMRVLIGLSFGASFASLLARVAGGIFRDATDAIVGNVIGRIESSIPDRDPQNPAMVPDLVGENIGDVGAIAADLFEAFTVAIVTAGLLGAGPLVAVEGLDRYSYLADGIAYSLYLGSVALASAVIGILSTSMASVATPRADAMLNTFIRGALLSFVTGVILAAVVTFSMEIGWQFFFVYVIGAFVAILFCIATGAFTSVKYTPARAVAHAGRTGPATVIIKGLAVGLGSVVPLLLVLAFSIVGVLYLADGELGQDSGAGKFGIAIAALGAASQIGVILCAHTFNGVSHNAAAVAELAEVSCTDEVRQRTHVLDSVGDALADVGRGYALGMAALTSISALFAFGEAEAANLDLPARFLVLDAIHNNLFVPALLLGAMVPFVFSSLVMRAVHKGARVMQKEVMRQFKEIDGLKDAHRGVRPDFATATRVTFRGVVQYAIVPISIVIGLPIVVGIALGANALVGVLLGSILSCTLLGSTMINAGGAWRNSRQIVSDEKLQSPDGHVYARGSVAHRATVIGDEVGGPFKDATGPSINTLMRAMPLVALIFVALWRPAVDKNWEV